MVEGEAPTEREAVGEALTVLLEESVDEGVGAAVPVPETVGVGDRVALGVGCGVPLLDCELLPVMEGEAPTERDAVGEALTVLLAESVEEGVGAAVPVPDTVGVGDRVALGVGCGVPLLDCELLPVAEGEAPTEREAVGEALVVPLAESVEEGVGAGVPVPLVVELPVEVPEGVTDAVALLL